MESQPLAAYLPMELRHALASGSELADGTQGAALFADMSGFTALSTAFAAAVGATAGAEAVTAELATVFDRLVREVHDYGGSVIGFSGDAITCWFDEHANARDSAAARATTAAIRMRDAISALPAIDVPGGASIALGVKLAVAAGPARRFLVGDPLIQQLEAMGGETMRRMADAEGTAAAGEVVVGPEVVDALGATVEVATWRTADDGQRFAVLQAVTAPADPAPWPPLGRVESPALQPWVLSRIQERIQRGEGQFLGGFRPVVAVFLSFDGLDYDGDREAGAKLDRLFRSVQSSVDQNGGHVVDITIGDKGSYLFAAFGALQVHEDAARRALATALTLGGVGSLGGGQVEIRLGVAQSRVYTGSYGCDARMTFGVVGSEVNVAARLMSAARPGEILVAPAVAKAAGDSFDFADHGELRLKGAAEAMRPRRLISEAGSAEHRTRRSTQDLIGREAERALIASALDALIAGSGGGVIIEGEAGMGKSRLLDHALQEAEKRGVRVMFGAADAMRDVAAYYPWRGIFEGILPSGAGAVAKLRDVDELLVPLAPLLNAVASLELPESEATRHMEGRVRADNTNSLLSRLLAHEVGSGPALILLEDLHWFDSASFSLLAELARELPSCLIIATRRPPVSDAARALAQDPWSGRAHLVRIDRLEIGEVAQLIAQSLEVSTLPEPMLQLVERKAEGSPFFSQEIAFALRDAGHVVIEGTSCTLAPGVGDLTELDFPDTIQGVLASRVDRMSPSQQMALKVASVIGRTFDVALLREILPVQEDKAELESTLDALEAADIALRDEGSPVPAFTFRHALTQEVAYDMLLHQQRRDLHLAVTRWYEEEHADDLAPHHSVLAYHMGRAARDGRLSAAEFSKALAYLEAAGQEAVRSHSNHEAVHFFREALELDAKYEDSSPPSRARAHALRRARWGSGLATAYVGLGRFHLCQAVAQDALARLGHALPSNKLRLIWGIVVQEVVHKLRHRRMDDPIRVEIEGEEAEVLTEVNYLRRILSKSFFHENGLIEMRYLNTRSLNVAERLGPTSDLALAYSHETLAQGISQHPSALDYGKRAIEVARAAGRPDHLVTVFVNHGMYHLGMGEFDAAIALHEEGTALAAQIRDQWQWGEMTAQMADIAWLRGDVARSIDLYGQVYQAAEPRSMYIQMAWCWRPRALGALREDRPSDAIEVVESTRGIWGEVPDTLTKIDAIGVMALAHVRMGHISEALEHIDEADALVAHVSPPVAYPRLLGYAALSETCISLFAEALESAATNGERTEHRKRARRWVKLLVGYAKAFPIGRPAARLHSGWLAWLGGKNKAARLHLMASLEAAHKMHMRFDEAAAHLLLARTTSEADDASRAEHLRAAHQLFTELNATREATLAERELDTVRQSRAA